MYIYIDSMQPVCFIQRRSIFKKLREGYVVINVHDLDRRKDHGKWVSWCTMVVHDSSILLDLGL